jgi:hypothetical protein
MMPMGPDHESALPTAVPGGLPVTMACFVSTTWAEQFAHCAGTGPIRRALFEIDGKLTG